MDHAAASGGAETFLHLCAVPAVVQIMTDAVHDGLIAKSPCSRRISPGLGEQRVYVATTEQVWQLYELFPERMRLAVLLGAFAGLRLAETCGLRVKDIDFLRAGRFSIPPSGSRPRPRRRPYRSQPRLSLNAQPRSAPTGAPKLS
jgi:integrase